MDQNIQLWLKRYKKFKTREEVNDRILDDLPDIVTDVRRSRFSLDLPPVFNNNSMPEDRPQGPSYKKKKTRNTANIPEDNHRKKVVHNPTPNPNEEYKMREGEEYSKLFRGQTVCRRVDWPGGKRCDTAFIPECFASAIATPYVASHVPQSQVPAEQDRNYKRFPKKARSDK